MSKTLASYLNELETDTFEVKDFSAEHLEGTYAGSSSTASTSCTSTTSCAICSTTNPWG